ncbi:MAG TPA: DUF6268 family outer membrane beta-barrel protein [Ferruginibacter sp.]|nr:DUF6268 family outer membrane beta-barrel protein [Ferruginibacter sp.]
MNRAILGITKCSKNKTNRSLFYLLVPAAFIFIIPGRIAAQPFLDIVHVKYNISPDAGLLNQNKNDLKLQYFSVSTNLPVQFKNKKDALIFSPYFEKWRSQVNKNTRQDHTGIALPVSLIKSIPETKWSILLTAIARMNDSGISKKTTVQIGGAFIAGYKRNEKLTWKLGLYINNDLFGIFVMPLLGIDWKINERNNLFGVLLGNLTYEHKINKYFYYGASFRAITNSYGNTSGYWRIDENQLGLYLDTYLAKNFVLNIEAGHSVLRKIRTGVKEVWKSDAKVNNNVYVKLAIAYRVRFSKR